LPSADAYGYQQKVLVAGASKKHQNQTKIEKITQNQNSSGLIGWFRGLPVRLD